MPEFAEAALMAEEMNEATHGRLLSRVLFVGDRPSLQKIIPPPVQKVWRSFMDKPIEISSRGKRVYFRVAKSEIRIGVHLGMSGDFSIEAPTAERRRHTFLNLAYKGASIYYSDYRRFSRMRLYDEEENSAIGGWSLQRGFFLSPTSQLKRAIGETLGNFRRKPRISWLLEHGKTTGIGNYMANDALGRLDLSPYEPVKSPEEALKILRECQKVAAAVYRGGGGLSGVLRFYEAKQVPRSLYRGRPLYTRFSIPR